MNTSAILGAIDVAVAANSGPSTAAVSSHPSILPVQPRFTEDVIAMAEPTPAPVAPKTTRKPGRPPKKKEIPADVHGIITTPSFEANYVEMVTCNPTIFKKILALHKAYAAPEIEFCFGHKEVVLRARDHHNRSTLYTTFDCNLLNIYYCREPISVVIKREYLDHIIGPPDKTNHKITFILRENWRSVIYIIVKDMIYEKENRYEIDVIRQAEQPSVIDDDSEYPLQFTFDSRHFKSEITKLSQLSKLLTIEKVDGGALTFIGDNSTKPKYHGVYESKDKIALVDKLPARHVFRVSVAINYIKPMATATIGERITIAVDTSKRISMTTMLDQKVDGRFGIKLKLFADLYGGVNKAAK